MKNKRISLWQTQWSAKLYGTIGDGKLPASRHVVVLRPSQLYGESGWFASGLVSGLVHRVGRRLRQKCRLWVSGQSIQSLTRFDRRWVGHGAPYASWQARPQRQEQQH